MAGVVVIVATNAEARYIPRNIRVVSGVGASRARLAIDLALERDRPDLVISAGFAGALDPALRVGDLVRPSRVSDEHGGAIEVADGDGRILLSLDHVASVQAKTRLRAEHHADAVDMESVALARTASERGLRFMVIRSICDPADFALPTESASWVDHAGRARPFEVFRWSGLSPHRCRLLLRLQRNAGVAARRLGEAIAQYR